MTNAHLSRGFSTLRTHGVALRGRKIDIIDRVALQTYAHPDPLIDDLNS
jgi:CRP/FNR family transcriptional activator FtrB